MTDSIVLKQKFYNFSKQVKSQGQQYLTESSDAEKKMVVEVLKSLKGCKRKMKQSKIEIHGEKKKLVVKLPASDSSSPGSGPKRTSSPVLIDLDSNKSDSAKSSCSARQTRNSSKCKLESSPPSAPVKKHKGEKDLKPKKEEKNKKEEKTKKEEQPKKEGKTKSNGKI